jgi:hypothetical protein
VFKKLHTIFVVGGVKISATFLTVARSMYSPSRLLFARNLVLAIANGLITLVILLIAPLGLAAVIINTLLVACSTFMLSVFGDVVVRWLLQGTNPHGLPTNANPNVGITPQTSHQPTQRPDRW